MIDARTFAHGNNSFWDLFAPGCEHFVRKINLGLSVRFWDEIPRRSEADRSAFVSETAFYILRESKRHHRRLDDPSVLRKALKYAASSLSAYSTRGLNLETKISSIEQDEILRIASSLARFFSPHSDILFSPLFDGCGFIEKSQGDIVAECTLFEVKSVTRPFRSTEIRQLVTYSALNHAAQNFNINSVGVVNPRKGLSFQFTVDELALEISGASASTLFGEMISAISSSGISR